MGVVEDFWNEFAEQIESCGNPAKMKLCVAPQASDPRCYDLGGAWLFAENVCVAALSQGLGTQLFAYWNETTV